MAEPTQITEDEPPIDDVAQAIHDSVAERHKWPWWEDCSEDMKEVWRRTVKELRDIAKGNYDD